MEKQPNLLETAYDREERLRNDTETWLAEVLDGSMRTPFEYHFDGHELYGDDGSALKPIFTTAIQDAERLVKDNSALAFELRRRHIEMAELEAMYAIMRDELPNTMVVISDFPPELQTAQKDIGGYNVARKQTMLRVISKSEDDTLQMTSQSLDGSDRLGLEAIYRYLGFHVQPGELLGQRMHIEIDSTEQPFITDELMGVYDRSLTEKYGGLWRAGRANTTGGNTYDFVRQQTDIIDAFVNMKLTDPNMAESQRYNLAALLEKRYAEGQGQIVNQPVLLKDYLAVINEWQQAGKDARQAGKNYSGCGITASGPGMLDTEGQIDKLGYGNKSEKNESKKIPDKIRCINCKVKVPSKEVIKPTSWCCPNCNYEVDICTGKILCQGNKR